jgi:hypothetical protein
MSITLTPNAAQSCHARPKEYEGHFGHAPSPSLPVAKRTSSPRPWASRGRDTGTQPISTKCQYTIIRTHGKILCTNHTSAWPTALFPICPLTLCRYSYATSVKPNCGLLRIIRAGPPLKNALNPSSRSRNAHQTQPRQSTPSR